MRLNWFIASLLPFVFGTSAIAQSYPEFAGVYAKVEGEYIELTPMESVGKVRIFESVLVPYQGIRLTGRTYPEEHAQRQGRGTFWVVNDVDVQAAPLITEPIESIFVQLGFPHTEVRYDFVSQVFRFATIIDAGPKSQGVETQELAGYPRADYPTAHIKTNCGWSETEFNVKIVSQTATEFFPKSEIKVQFGPTLGQCGKAHTAPTSAMTVGVGGKTYGFRTR